MKTTVYITTRSVDADDAVMCVKDLVKGTNLEVKAEKVDNDGVPAMHVNVYGDKVAMDGFVSAYKDSYANIEDICDVDPMGWTDPVDLKYYTKDESKQKEVRDAFGKEFVVGMMISLDGVTYYIQELKPRTVMVQSVDTAKEFSLPIASLNRAVILYAPKNMESKQGKKNEGPGAGYTVTIKDMEISDEPKVEYDEKKGVFTVEANVEYEANAEGYDWSTDYVMHDVIGTDVGTFPHNPYKGVLKLEMEDSEEAWGNYNPNKFEDPENPTIQEKLDALKYDICKGASFNDFDGGFGGGFVHSEMSSEIEVSAFLNWYGVEDFEMSSYGELKGTLTIDPYFIGNIEFAHGFSGNLYELVDAVKEYLEGKGVDMDTISEESLYDDLGPWVTDEITPEYVKEVVTDALSYMDFVDANGEPVVVESKKSEADYARASKPVADAYKVLDNYYLDNGKLSDFLTEQVLMTYKNDGAMYSRSKSKAVKSHSLAWESLLATINALLEWDDETEHATKLTSEQVKNWFKANGMDYKEALKPLVDAIENQRKEWFGESKQEEGVVIPKVSSDAIHSKSVQTGYYTDNSGLCHIYVDGVEKDVVDFDKAVDAGYNLQESKKSEKLTQKDLKQMATSGAAIDITNVSDDEAKEIRSRKLDTVAISRGTYGMNGALLKDKDGKTYVITARNSNLFYFV